MADWSFDPSGLKKYPHLGRPLSVASIERLVQDPDKVARHPFSPFIRYHETYRPFRRKNGEGSKRKDRPIRYAAHADAYIYSYYRQLLSNLYEAALTALDISDCVIAYRKIPVSAGSSAGKCNIHHAAEAFQLITALDRSCAITLDISSYFDSIDHERLSKVWCRLLGADELPPDHAAVFRNITCYADVDRDELYVRLGYAKRIADGSLSFLRKKRQMPTQLCSWKKLRQLAADQGKPKLLVRNPHAYGIPQGSPISDVLANAYLLEFDSEMATYVRTRGGFYRRYSDDILIVLPGDGRVGAGARKFAISLIQQFGKQLTIKKEKCTSVCFVRTDVSGEMTSRYVSGGKKADGLEYLGFRFDGRKAYLRNSTISRLKRKMRHAARAHAHKLVARYPGKNLNFLLKRFNQNRFLQRFGKVDFESNPDAREMTFWSYAKRSSEVLGARGSRICRQIKNDPASIARMIERELTLALLKRDR